MDTPQEDGAMDLMDLMDSVDSMDLTMDLTMDIDVSRTEDVSNVSYLCGIGAKNSPVV